MNRVHILLIEDNPADVELLRRAFVAAKLDCQLTILEDGAEALALVRRLEAQPGEPAPDLIVLDLNGRYITKPADLDKFLGIGFILKDLLTEDGLATS